MKNTHCLMTESPNMDQIWSPSPEMVKGLIFLYEWIILKTTPPPPKKKRSKKPQTVQKPNTAPFPVLQTSVLIYCIVNEISSKFNILKVIDDKKTTWIDEYWVRPVSISRPAPLPFCAAKFWTDLKKFFTVYIFIDAILF